MRVFELSVLPVNIWSQKTSEFSDCCKPCNRSICWTFWKLVSFAKSNFDRYNQQTILLLYMCWISDPLFDLWFSTCHFYLSKCDITRPANFRKFLQTAEESFNRSICRTCCKLGSLVKSNFDSYDLWIILLLYMCQISDSLFDMWFSTCHFYPSKCGIMRPPNFHKFLQTAEECCDRNISWTFWKLGSLIKLNFDR